MIYLVIPRLVRQQSWGGTFIPDQKGLELKKEIIGQSYEFYSGSKVVPAKLLAKMKPVKYPYVISSNKKEDEEIKNKIKGIVDITDLDPKDLFGTRIFPTFMIKYTQAKGNSYQLHVKNKVKNFQPKPESWYFFTKGAVTLGVRDGADIKEYHEACADIYKLTKELSKQIKARKKSIEDARQELWDLIDVKRIDKYVNTVRVNPNSIIENAVGGIHHSWEEDRTLPEGSIIYEVQKEEFDETSTLRAFDQGKIMDDGSYRELTIEDYFENLDTNIYDNDPNNKIRTQIKLKDLKAWKLNKIFNTAHYQMDELVVVKDYRIENLGFRHLFVRKGSGTLKTQDETIELKQGYSYLIPDSESKILIKNTTSKLKGEEEAQSLRLLPTYKREHLKK